MTSTQTVTKKGKGRPGLSGTAQKPPKGTTGTPSLDLFQDPETVRSLGAIYWRKKQNRDQIREIYRGAKQTGGDFGLIRSAVSLKYCNNSFLMRETPSGTMHKVSTWNCGRKFCSICASKKRRKLLFRYLEFFESESGQILLDSYDLALFTVTLQHSKDGIRRDPYYKELSSHWRNGMKYGAFKKYISGGFYNTEHTYTKNGHHIHRHALVLIPKDFELRKNLSTIVGELRDQWKSRTGGSFQIDLTPFNEEKTLKENLLEVTKYVTKRGKGGVVPWQIVKAMGENSRHKFYGKFGILHKVKELNLNFLEDTPVIETDPELLERPLSLDKLFVCNGLKAISREKAEKGKKPEYINYFFKEKTRIAWNENVLSEFAFQSLYSFNREYYSQLDRFQRGFFYKEWKEWKGLQERLNNFKNEAVTVQLPMELFN